jgi:predicted DCC family thiol-disulfide oxidoreductase YuxK
MVVVFDGVCIFCNRWVQFLLRHDRHQRLSFAHYQSAYAAPFVEQLGEDPMDPSTVLLIDGATIHVRSTAAIRAVGAMGGVWRVILVLLIVPRPLRDAAYLAFARRRYRWFGRTDQCAVPDPRWQSRFLA